MRVSRSCGQISRGASDGHLRRRDRHARISFTRSQIVAATRCILTCGIRENSLKLHGDQGANQNFCLVHLFIAREAKLRVAKVLIKICGDGYKAIPYYLE